MSKTWIREMVKWLTVLVFLCCARQSVFAWDSVKSATEMDTHKMIAEQGVLILQNDLADNSDPELAENLQLLIHHLDDLKRGAVWPDFNSDEYALYQDHFFDPDTGKNFTNGYIPDTAESQTRLFVAIALDKWKSGDYSGAAFELGTACHFYADVNEPHHASNQTGGEGTAHTAFEQWVEDVKYDYEVTTSGYDTNSSFYTDALAIPYLSDYLYAQSYVSAKKAKSVVQLAQMTSTWDDWEYVAEATMREAQTGVARIVFRFLHEVTDTFVQNPPDPIGKFHVLIQTADEKNAGTDDYVYFGMELADGRTVEFECNVPGNDFYRGLRWGYEFEITDPSFTAADITRIWLRKYDFWGDAWKPQSIAVYMKGKKVFGQTINEWLDSGWWHRNVTYGMDVNGFVY